MYVFVFFFLNRHNCTARILEVMFTNIQKTSSFSLNGIDDDNQDSKSPVPLTEHVPLILYHCQGMWN